MQNSHSPTVVLERPSDIHAGLSMLLAELEDWLAAAEAHHLERDWEGIHDEGTFLTAWAGYYAYTEDARVLTLAQDLFRKWRGWSEDHFIHGYHPRQEVHHGTEHFIIFLDWLRQISPADDTAVGEALLDAAHHAGNWADDAPDWFDWERNRYVSYDLGTEHVGQEGFNFVDHMRLLHLALAGWRVSQEPHYMDLCRTYGTAWAQALTDGRTIPLYLDAEAFAPEAFEAVLRSFIKAAPQEITDHARVENHVASGTPKLLMELWEVTADALFLEAAVRLGRHCTAYVDSPIANPAGSVLSQLILCGVEPDELGLAQSTFTDMPAWPALHGGVLAMTPDTPPSRERDSIGYRHDLPDFELEHGGNRSPLVLPAPANLMLGWTLTGNPDYALDAICLALGKLRLARRVFRDGRHHGCTAQSVAATVRGHGRCWGLGDVSAVLTHIGARRAFAAQSAAPRTFPGLITN